MLRFSITSGHLRNVLRLSSSNSVQNDIVFPPKFLQCLHCQMYHPMKNTDSDYRITSLGQEGRVYEARKLFDQMCNPNVVTWTSMITCYIKHEMIEEARELFDRPDVKKNVITWTAMVCAYIRVNKIMEAEKLFNEMPAKNIVSWNTMIDGYVQNSQIDSALHLFKKMPERNVVSWNLLINAFVQYERIDDAYSLFECMPERDVVSWTAIVGGLSKAGRVDEAREVFDRMPDRNQVSWCSMITGYAQNRRLHEAFKLFQTMPEKHILSWNSMMAAFIQNKDLNGAKNLFDEMPHRNVISWTTMITGYVQDTQNEAALKTFSQMHKNTKPNHVTFIAVLGACCNSASVCEGQQLHQLIIKMAFESNPPVVSSLISMYSKCGDLGLSIKIFSHGFTIPKDLITWNAMIGAYAQHGQGLEAIDLFRKMEKLGIKPNDVTYVGLLSACSHCGFVDEGIEFFNHLLRDASIKTKENHYGCIVDLCGRAGRLDDAFKFVELLGSKASGSVLGALLAGCNVHGNVELGELVASKLMEVEPENAVPYVLLSNIYGSKGMWSEAKRVREEMVGKGLKKVPGCCLD